MLHLPDLLRFDVLSCLFLDIKMAGDSTILPDFFHASAEQFWETSFLSPGDDIFSVVDDLDGVSGERGFGVNPLVSNFSGALQLEALSSPKRKRLKRLVDGGGNSDGQQKVSHIRGERNRRKQMNEHLSVLRSLMPCFYVKRGDQASIIGGVVDYITELQQILQSLEAKKQRKVYSHEVVSPRLVSSPRTLAVSPRSPRPSLPISPTTPQPANPYRPPPSPAANYNELMANSKSAIAQVEVKFAGDNLLLKTWSSRIPGQATKVIALLENLSLEVLQTNISIVDEAMVNSFTIKIGVECQLSAEELAQHIQHSFC